MLYIGVDEVGRGCVWGPITAAAVCLPEESHPEAESEFIDSKKTTPKQRERLSRRALDTALAAWVHHVPASRIDEVGIVQANCEAMEVAVDQVHKALRAQGIHVTDVVVDGIMRIPAPAPGVQVHAVVRADATHANVSAASIVAKVARDTLVRQACDADPTLREYGLHTNMGYLTKTHREALQSRGPATQHRKSFEPCKSME
jgi:ribonuclease HII